MASSEGKQNTATVNFLYTFVYAYFCNALRIYEYFHQ